MKISKRVIDLEIKILKAIEFHYAKQVTEADISEKKSELYEAKKEFVRVIKNVRRLERKQKYQII